jgi:signal transduction histidine kinase
MRESRIPETLLDRVLQAAVLAYQGLGVATFVLAVIFASSWLSTPYLGGLYQHTLVLSHSGSSGAGTGMSLREQGVTPGDQLTSVNGVPVQSWSQVRAVMRGQTPGTLSSEKGFAAGDTIPLTIRTPSGDERALSVTLRSFPAADRLTFVVLPLAISVLFLALSLLAMRLRGAEPAGRAFALLTASFAIVAASLFDLHTSHYLTHLWTLSLAVTGGALLNLGLVFPQAAPRVMRYPALRWAGMILALILTAVAYSTLFDYDRPSAYLVVWRLIYIFVGLSLAGFLRLTLNHARTARSPVARAQAGMILAGAIAGFVPTALGLVAVALEAVRFSLYLFAPIILFPLTIGYALLRFEMPRIEPVLRRGPLYIVLMILAVAGYGLLASGLSLILAPSIAATGPLWAGALVFLIAVALDPVRARLRSYLDLRFLHGERAYEAKLADISQQLTAAPDLAAIGAVLRQEIASILAPSQIHIFTFDTLSEQYLALPGTDERPSSDIRFPAKSRLVRHLEAERAPLYLDGFSALPPALVAERFQLMLLAARLFLGLRHGKPLAGWLALGDRLSGAAYSPRDLIFLEDLCRQAAAAIDRVRNTTHLEQRLQEMNALTRVSQGVNITLEFNDVLELIYAQTAQIIATSHFHVTLLDRDSSVCHFAFYLEDDERLPERENTPLSAGSGLAPEVIRTNGAIHTSNYLLECRKRGRIPDLEGVFAWMGVPLIAGTETIGALSVGSGDRAVAYTAGQLDLLQAIANQTAGAIVKARLLQDSRRRAQELSALSEITRQLTSTLELEPLLQNILENAVEILNCEAGTLFLAEEQGEGLNLRATVGAAGAITLGQRLSPADGLTAGVAAKRAPVIENRAQDAPDWFNSGGGSDVVVRALLAVPLQAKDRLLGVLEVLNRRDGLPFVVDDQTLLTTFAGQAAVAIENARLYTLTDQELAARVEELSVMQRIDRELNTSLEMDRAMRITLDWALRQSRAEAGLIGMLEQDRLRVMSQRGYDEQLTEFPEQSMPLDLPALRAAVQTGQAQHARVPEGGDGLLPSARSQLVIPIRREARVIGLLMLESETDSRVDLGFLSRLSDHAAIAISNAQLYGEVERANLAKTEFVSFVAHELKSPMTSIKGYTELVAAGAVGEVNEMQANFLRTINSNVDRMSTLVSDLNDDSKIEAGRLRLDYKATALAGVLDEVIEAASRQVADKRHRLDVQFPPDLPAVWADSTRVSQVLTNLISNANKYTPEGGLIEVGAAAAANQWDPGGAARVVHIWVKDSGIGIGLEDQEKIFQKFFRSEDNRVRESSGSGLGLNITKSLVEMQGGRIWFESELGRGATFHFTVPVAEA